MTKREAFADLLIARSTAPMEARLVDALPDEGGWQFEPKWDGFRCLVFRDGRDVALMSKSGKPLGRYFPELVEAVLRLPQDRFVLDGEIILPLGDTLSFSALQARLHPAASRIERLAQETPAKLMLFDCLQVGSVSLLDQALSMRREELEKFAGPATGSLLVSPFTCNTEIAAEWLARTGGALDGVVAKRRDQPYRPGERAMFKRKVHRTADCVVGGFRLDRAGEKVASLLLGLFDDEGLLHYVGYTSSFTQEERQDLLTLLRPLEGDSAFTGSSPGGPSRWSTNDRKSEWVSLRAEKVVEVRYDQVTGKRFRHGTTFCRWRPDKAARQCTFDQLQAELKPEQLEQILADAAV